MVSPPEEELDDEELDDELDDEELELDEDDEPPEEELEVVEAPLKNPIPKGESEFTCPVIVFEVVFIFVVLSTQFPFSPWKSFSSLSVFPLGIVAFE